MSTCNNASRANMIIGVEKQDSLESAGAFMESSFAKEDFYKNSSIYKDFYDNYSKKYYDRNGNINETIYESSGFSNVIKEYLSKRCWNNVDRVINMESEENVFKNHKIKFNEDFSKVELSLDSKSDAPLDLSGSVGEVHSIFIYFLVYNEKSTHNKIQN